MMMHMRHLWVHRSFRLVLVIVLAVLTLGSVTVLYYQRNDQGGSTATAVAAIDRWATAAASGDLATARDLLVDEPLHRLAFQDRWPRTLQAYGIVPGHSVSNVVQQGQSTTATVHFRTGDGAFCMNVLADRQQRVMILNEVGRCPFAQASAAP